MLRSNVIVLAGGFAAVAVSCQRRDAIDERTPYVLTSDSEWTFATSPTLPLAATDLRDLTSKAFENSGRFVPATDDGRSPLVAKVFAEILSAASTPTDDNRVAIDVQVRLEFVPPLSDASASLTAVASGNARGTAAEAPRTAVLAALGRALEQIGVQQKGQSLSNAELIAQLNSSEPPVVDMALSRLAARHSAASFGPLTARLKSPDSDLAQQTLGYLVSLNDPRAARYIIEASEERHLTFRIEALYALGSLGGEDAEAYLFTLTSSPDVRVRTVATEALSLAKRRSAMRPGAAQPRPAEVTH